MRPTHRIDHASRYFGANFSLQVEPNLTKQTDGVSSTAMRGLTPVVYGRYFAAPVPRSHVQTIRASRGIGLDRLKNFRVDIFDAQRRRKVVDPVVFAPLYAGARMHRRDLNAAFQFMRHTVNHHHDMRG